MKVDIVSGLEVKSECFGYHSELMQAAEVRGQQYVLLWCVFQSVLVFMLFEIIQPSVHPLFIFTQPL